MKAMIFAGKILSILMTAPMLLVGSAVALFITPIKPEMKWVTVFLFWLSMWSVRWM